MKNSGVDYVDHSWNFIDGCLPDGPECAKCYAARTTARFSGVENHRYNGLAVFNNKGDGVFVGETRFAFNHLFDPIHWTEPAIVFANDFSDTFFEKVPDEWIDLGFASAIICHWHIFLFLTKRAARQRSYMTSPSTPRRIAGAIAALCEMERSPLSNKARQYWAHRAASGDIPFPPPNVWAGVSCGMDRRKDRIADLVATPAARRWVSIEPQIDVVTFEPFVFGTELVPSKVENPDGIVDMMEQDVRKLDWIVVGGESGPGARPFKSSWIEYDFHQAIETGTPLFFKQLGGLNKGNDPAQWPKRWRVRQYPKTDHPAIVRRQRIVDASCGVVRCASCWCAIDHDELKDVGGVCPLCRAPLPFALIMTDQAADGATTSNGMTIAKLDGEEMEEAS